MEPAVPRENDPFARLTPPQREAVTAEDQRLAVFAGAGAGKTRVLTLRVARMVDDGVDPTHVLAITFSQEFLHNFHLEHKKDATVKSCTTPCTAFQSAPFCLVFRLCCRLTLSHLEQSHVRFQHSLKRQPRHL